MQNFTKLKQRALLSNRVYL